MKNMIWILLLISLFAFFNFFHPVVSEARQSGDDIMPIGTNFWNFEWGTGHADYYEDGIDWSTVENPWRREFLDDIRIYSVIRFMDQVPTNSSTVRNWSERTLPNENHYTTNRGAVAYEWQIDLVNRTGVDIWITVPHLTIESYEDDPENNYWTELAALLKDELDPELNIYVEYSNETWSGGDAFQQGDYAGDRGVEMGFDPDHYTSKFYFHVYAAMRLHKVFIDTFDDEPERIKTVVAGQDGSLWGTRQIVRALQNETWSQGANPDLNPWDLEPDYFAIANYLSTGNGADPDIRNAWTEQLESAANHYQEVIDEISSTGMQLISYEGGQHYTTNAHLFSQNPHSYSMYLEWLETVSDYFELSMHYTHTGVWNSGGAWGAKATTTQSLSDAHKYRALKEWVLGLSTEITDIYLSAGSVDEGLPAGTLVGELTTNVFHDEAFLYTLVDGDTGSFEINDNQMLTAGVFDYSVKNSYEITIRATDPGDAANFAENDFTITVNKVVDIPDGYEVVLNPVADTWTQGDPDGTSPDLRVSFWSHILMKYDLSDISSDMEVLLATARIAHNPGQFDGADHTLYIYETLTESWNEDDSEEELGPALNYDSFIDSQQVQVSQEGYIEFNVTGYVRSRLEDTAGLGYRTNDGVPWQWYFSREHPEYKPELVLITDSEITMAEDYDNRIEIALNQNYPNPFNPTTVISYELPQTSDIRLEVFDLLGRHMITLEDGQMPAGHHQNTFDAGSLSSGIYIYRLQADGMEISRKLTVIK